jgi:hypothetical protein
MIIKKISKARSSGKAAIRLRHASKTTGFCTNIVPMIRFKNINDPKEKMPIRA